MRRACGALTLLPTLLAIQSLAGCAWVENQPMVMQLPGTADAMTPCIAGNLGKEFQDTVPVVDRGNTPGSREITINAPRGGMLGFVTVAPIPSGGTEVTYYDGKLYWPSNVTSGVFQDFARDNWHRAERAIMDCGKDEKPEA